MKTPDISTIHETVLHGDMRFHLMVHEFASDPSRSERVTSHWHEEYELLFLTEGNVRCSLYIFKELLWKNFRCGRCTHGSVPKRNNFLDRKDSSERRYQFE